MNLNNIVWNKFRELNNDSWIRRILPFGLFLFVATFFLKYYWNFLLADPINYGAWGTFFLACFYKYRDSKKNRKKVKSEYKPPPDDFYV